MGEVINDLMEAIGTVTQDSETCYIERNTLIRAVSMLAGKTATVRWEYSIRQFSSMTTSRETIAWTLNEVGKEGWELSTILYDSTQHTTTMFIKRRLP